MAGGADYFMNLFIEISGVDSVAKHAANVACDIERCVESPY